MEAMMNVRLHRAGIELDTRRFLTLDDALGTRILCVAGELWITQHRDTSDHLVAQGDWFTVDAPGKVVIQAQRPARVALVEAQGASAARRFARALGRVFDRWCGIGRIDSRPNPIVATHGA
jgi:hypothetical protein